MTLSITEKKDNIVSGTITATLAERPTYSGETTEFSATFKGVLSVGCQPMVVEAGDDVNVEYPAGTEPPAPYEKSDDWNDNPNFCTQLVIE